ncbi:hypothetical protein BX666DRAFT_1853235 [Dichotomocladium elegans]|nr:hypothetical protein BX666DRAFT_1853235 [Dichotomocladium elegans]
MAGWIQTLTYDIALWLFCVILDIFFREVRPRGSHRIPKEGPVIFVCAPHANQFVDPIIVMRESGRRISFLIAEKSMHQKGIGTFARMINAIPVIRPQDLAVAGKGRIQLLNRKTEPLRIVGVDTEFTQQLRPQDMIVLPRNAGRAEITEVISDTELIIKKEFKELKALELLTSNEGSSYKCVPHVEQDSVYKKVFDELNNGCCISIFPEGGSHDRAELLPLKAGVTVMALGAMAKYPGLDVKIVPACGKLLDIIHGALKSVTVNAGNFETLMLIQAARRLYKPAYRKLQISQVVDLNRRFLIGYTVFKDDPKVVDLQQRVLAYNQMLKYHGIRDHQVSRTDIGGRRALTLFLKRVFILSVLTLWAFPGGILNLPVAIVAKVISAQKAKAAVKGSTVKIAGRDILATWKILVALGLIPLLYAFYSFCMLVAVLRTDWDIKWKILLPVATWISLPFISYASLRFGEIGLDILRSLQPLYMAAFDTDAINALRANREKLSHDLTELINEYGPKVFPDFDAEYISRGTQQQQQRPAPSRTTSSSSFSWAIASPSKLPKIASGFFQQATRMGLDDRNIFNWNRIEESSDMDDGSFYLGGSSSNFSRLNGSMTPTSRRSSMSESESTTTTLMNSGSRSSRSRTSSFGTDGFRVEAMTSLGGGNAAALKQRPLFKIDDYDEATIEEKLAEDEGYAGDRDDDGNKTNT